MSCTRTGECKHCGTCCRIDGGVGFPCWLKARAPALWTEYAKGGFNGGYCVFFDLAAHVRNINPDRSPGEPLELCCTIYEDRPAPCYRFPHTKEQVVAHPGCGFRVEED